MRSSSGWGQALIRTVLAGTLLSISLPVQAAVDQGAARSDVQSFLWTASGSRLIDAAGREVLPDDLRDKVVAIGFFNTQCSAPCALRMLDFAKVAAALPPRSRQRVVFLALTGDPAHDAPADLRQFAAGMGIAPEAITLVATDAPSTERLFQSIRWQQGPAAPDNVPPTVFVFDRLGQSAMRYDASPMDRPRLARDLTTLVGFSHGVGSPPDAAPVAP